MTHSEVKPESGAARLGRALSDDHDTVGATGPRTPDEPTVAGDGYRPPLRSAVDELAPLHTPGAAKALPAIFGRRRYNVALDRVRSAGDGVHPAARTVQPSRHRDAS